MLTIGTWMTGNLLDCVDNTIYLKDQPKTTLYSIDLSIYVLFSLSALRENNATIGPSLYGHTRMCLLLSLLNHRGQEKGY